MLTRISVVGVLARVQLLRVISYWQKLMRDSCWLGILVVTTDFVGGSSPVLSADRQKLQSMVTTQNKSFEAFESKVEVKMMNEQYGFSAQSDSSRF
ncbi:hypothetical protein F511_33834 [Dorcoceras hygrometricum]|uniref:Uncharacterized protein n=1 Tax=Dorcoceras hygrometricum TaxID=472368 RepID=A0A2Z7AV06_9LAMI|nr:hypothetical protein F511_33834 [Dorcoceras hygrometricum]